MRIYVAHPKTINFLQELYKPLESSLLARSVDFIFPHKTSGDQFDSKSLFQNHGCDMVIAEVSVPATGVGIELGWANANNINIICFYKQGAKSSSSLQAVTNRILEYSDSTDLINKLTGILNS
jgi:nucleoside 2-deoxyribosyltransferase